ncbi:RNA polymerase II-associated protein 1 [Rhipicephalus sanguineus]|uniref:RNA polymerase II-associated protein 1 n=1 Tax=Rhipicephalus sanguineus TaxID=34632 RepID=UPI0018932CA5|nr:RNA polymerase II-associated protein 1 [Rhipicephalus sanguineus]
MDVCRPKQGETDEELIRLQEEFLKSGEKPSVQVVRAERKNHESEAKTHSVAEPNETTGVCDRNPPISASNASDKSPDVVHVQLESVLCDVIERNVDKDIIRPPSPTTVPFPEPTRVSGAAVQGRKSLFASRFKTLNAAGHKRDAPKPPSSMSPPGSALSKDDYEAVHAENLGRLASMSHEEKMKAQQELLSRLDPATVAFLRSRRKPADSDGLRREHARMASGDCISASKDNVHTDASSGTKQQMPGSHTKLHPLGFIMERSKLDSSKPNVTTASEVKINMPACSTTDTSEADDAQVPALDEEELPIKPSEAAQKWIHMDDVEKDKLQWMTMLPPVKAPDPKDAAAPCVGRFDFDGELVPPDQEVPIHRGLHHHGDNPELAGYSTAEILRLLRSQVRSQRLLALQLLERMLTKHWLGHYVGRLEGGDLLTQLLQSGLAPLVRSALDDRATVDAALAVLQALLVSQPEQALFGRAFLWRHGHHTFFLRPPTELENSSEISDVDLSQIDLVQALLRMDLLERLYYVLKTFRPGASGVASALLVMARLARHSAEAATKVLNHPHLINLIFKEFLPEHWSTPAVIKGKITEAYGNPMWPALELVRTIAAAGRELAETLLQRHRLRQCLAAYLALEPSASQLPTTDCLNLALEALRTWRVLLTYGLVGELCVDLYSVLARRLQLFSALDLDGVPFDLEYGAHLLHCLAVLPAETAKSCLAGLGVALNMVSKRWLTLLARATDLRSIQMGVYTVAAMLHCLSSMWKLGEAPDTSIVGTVQLVLNSQLATLMTSQLRSCSLFLTESERNKLQSDSSSSQCLPCVASEEPIPCEGWDMASFEFLASAARLLRVMAAKSEASKHEELSVAKASLLCNADVKAYLEELCSQAKHWVRRCSQRWLCRPEFNLLFELLRLAASETLDEDDAALYHEVSLTLLCTCAPGFQRQYLRVLQEVSFARNLACSQSSHSKTLSIEGVSATEMESITGCSVPVTASAKLDSAALSDIKAAYLKTFGTILRQINESSSVSLTLKTKPPYSYDWLYIPLHRLCALEEITRNYDRGHVLSCLRWAIHLLDARQHFMRAFPPLVHFTRLASVFLAGPELFLDMEVQGAMLLLLQLLEQTKLLCRTQRHLDLKDWPGLPSFSDFYLQLLEEYVGESYGDEVFASWLLVPLQGACDPHFRKLLFAENPEALAMTRLKAEQSVVPLSRFLEPPEENAIVLETYLKLLLSGRLNRTRSPLLHTIAEESVAQFVHSIASSPFKVHLLQVLSHHQKKEAAKRILRWTHAKATC